MSSPVSPHTTLVPSPSEEHSKCPRTLVLCFDGTGNRFEHDKNSNVVLLFQMLKRDNPEHQLVYYQTGIGTYAPTGFMSAIGAQVARALDEAFAWYLEDHVLGGYKFLMETYRAGDKICLFGFSRGAYTARALAAMLYRVGLLPTCNSEQIPFAYKIFKESGKEDKIFKENPDDSRGYLSKNFRSTFSRKVTVEFVGLWDTVESVGFFPRHLPNTDKNPIVKHVRHALSLDERRAKFKAAYWETSHKGSTIVTHAKKDQQGIDADQRTVEEVWFAGGHGDVGGGWEAYRVKAQLSRIPLRWIVREATEWSSILWDEKFLGDFKVRKPEGDKELAEYVEQERHDALAEFHKTIQFLNFYITILFPNVFRSRKIRQPTKGYPTKVHSSVKTRLKHFKGPSGQPYISAAQWDVGRTEFEDEWALPDDVPKKA
ncbi:hypothetical protein FRC04_000754 [Tulasnella sp. 424]|nr:hypothetical protein FRC04_000754 [Tulasnella sp. 424]